MSMWDILPRDNNGEFNPIAWQQMNDDFKRIHPVQEKPPISYCKMKEYCCNKYCKYVHPAGWVVCCKYETMDMKCKNPKCSYAHKYKDTK
jgi:hypothetical protein